MTRRFLCLPATVLLTAATLFPAALAETGPSGWKTVAVGKNAVMTPPDLAPGEFYQIVVFPRTAQGGAAITDFLDKFAARDSAARGKPSGRAVPAQAKSHNVALTTRPFVTAQGAARVGVYTALSVDGENARVVAVICSPSTALLRRYQSQQVAVLKYEIAQEKSAALSSGRGLAVEKTPPAPRGMTPGGKIVPGLYAGNAVTSNDGQIRARYRLYLFATGEFLLCDPAGKEVEFGDGDYKYDPSTGKMEIGRTFSLNNNRFDPSDAFCLYGHGPDGKAFLLARDNRGYAYRTTLLRYAGPAGRPSPRQAAAAKAAAVAEAKRYKFVTAPGHGVPTSQIAAIVHHYVVHQGSGVSGTNDVYLLLRDGTVHDGLPVPPDTLDVSLSRRREPQTWGHWRKSGSQYLAAWPDAPTRFLPLAGETALPAQHLSGRFGTGETSGSSVFGGSYRLWGVTFTPAGRFLKDNRGGASSGSLGQSMNGSSVESTYDDDGSYTSAVTPGAVAGAGHTKPGSHRGGTYSLSGYVLTLHYDDGRVARLPFFFTSPKRDQIYFEGANLARDTGK